MKGNSTGGQTVIEVADINKRFKVYYDKGGTLKERLLFRNRSHHEDRWVLRGISLSIKRGESVGLIGENGSGKSTLLKILSKILYPNKGSVKLSGRVSSLLELGAGFHPDLSGRENIYNNASIFGLTEKEIDKRLKTIIDFSELHEFIDNPVRTYSSGMYMRLAFSVAINVDADILLIDEILAVGDANFQRKCFNMMRDIKRKGTTILIVSHSLGQIEQICERSIWLDKGVIRMDGTPRAVHAEYLQYMDQRSRRESEQQAAQQEQQPEQRPPEAVEAASEQAEQAEPDAAEAEENPYASGKQRFGNFDIRIIDAYILNGSGKKASVFSTGESMTIVINYENSAGVSAGDVVAGIGFIRNDGVTAYGSNTFVDHGHSVQLANKGTIKCRIDENNMLNGLYKLDVALESTDGFPYDYIRGVADVEMLSPINDVGFVRIGHSWEIDGKSIAEI